MRVFVLALALAVGGLSPAYAYQHRHYHYPHHLRLHHHSHFRPLRQLVRLLDRPFHLVGKLLFDGKSYAFGSGGWGASVPLGTYEITPDAVGRWGARHKAIGINNGEIWDPGLKRTRDGIELHAGRSAQSDGCIAVTKDYAKLREAILKSIKSGNRLYMHISKDGIEINGKT